MRKTLYLEETRAQQWADSYLHDSWYRKKWLFIIKKHGGSIGMSMARDAKVVGSSPARIEDFGLQIFMY